MKINKCFITGTDTGVGKTVCSALILAAMQQLEMKRGYFKPVQTGVQPGISNSDDCERVRILAHLGLNEFVDSVYEYALPASPHIAAASENSSICVDRLTNRVKELDSSERFWLIEGAGGLLVPLTHEVTWREWIQAIQVPLLIISSTRLGTLNHTLLTLEAAQRSQIPVRGIFLVGDPSIQVKETLESWSPVPVLAEIPHLPSIHPQVVQEVAKERVVPALVRLWDVET